MNNRQIKFRVWNVDEKFFYTDPNSIKIDINGQIQRLYKGNEYVGDTPFWGEIYSEIVIQQFTGLLDKNGKEIYEGDVVKYKISDTQESIGEVKWNPSGYFYFDGLWKGVPETSFYKPEIIGNIFEKSS